jgi:hypothetical protein
VTHWFDKVSMAAVANERGLSRRDALAGAAVAFVVASPLASRGVAHAALRLEAVAATSVCQGCLNRMVISNNRGVENCLRTGNPEGKVVRRKKGKNKGKASPVSAAQKLGCVMRRHEKLGQDLAGCRLNSCEGPSAPPIETTPGVATCPPGTLQCSPTVCCYGNDICCPCARENIGWICCIPEVGCTCCG